MSARFCRRGIHALPDGARRCAQCARDSLERKIVKAVELPPVEITRAARCRPDTAEYFDGVTQDEVMESTAVEIRARLDTAAYVCRGCPVKLACLLWAREQGPALSGTFGGEYFGVFPSRYRETA